MNGTMYIETLTKDWDIHQGIFVDIFILHRCPNNKLLQLWQCFWAKCSVVKGLSMRNYDDKKGFMGFLVKFSKILPEWLVLDFALKQLYRFRNVKSDYFCNFLGKAVFKKGIYKKKWFENTEYLPFETVKLKVPCGLHDFLSERFGNYMIIPDQQSIKRAQHADKWYLEAPFEHSENRQYKDEHKLI